MHTLAVHHQMLHYKWYTLFTGVVHNVNLANYNIVELCVYSETEFYLLYAKCIFNTLEQHNNNIQLQF